MQQVQFERIPNVTFKVIFRVYALKVKKKTHTNYVKLSENFFFFNLDISKKVNEKQPFCQNKKF